MTTTERYTEQEARLPNEGRALVGSFDETTIVVYQAYRREIAQWAVAHQQLGGPHFKFTRMTWIKPSFLWMMYRSGWATKPDQEHVLAIRILRTTFDDFIRCAVPAQYDEGFGSCDEWKQAVTASDVRVQWDPDRDPTGAPLDRRAIQLGLRADALTRMAVQDVQSIEDITSFVQSQHLRLDTESATQILVPRQEVYAADEGEDA